MSKIYFLINGLFGIIHAKNDFGNMLLSICLVLLGLALLVFGADRFVAGAANTANRLGISPLIIGLTIVGVATSMPEMLVGSVAALDGKTSIAIGNAIGSNIANIGLVLGVTVLAIPLMVASKNLQREFMIMCAAILIACVLLLDQQLSRIDGGILLVALLVTIVTIVKTAKPNHGDPLADEYAEEIDQDMSMGKCLILLVIGLVLLLAGAEMLVNGAVTIAKQFGVSDLVIGLTIIAIGTSLPELAASVMSALKGEAELAIGNVIGSNMFNMLMVLSVPALIYPDQFGSEVIYRDALTMLILTLLMGWMVFINKSGKFTRWEGGVLFSCFIGYQFLLFQSATA